MKKKIAPKSKENSRLEIKLENDSRFSAKMAAGKVDRLLPHGNAFCQFLLFQIDDTVFISKKMACKTFSTRNKSIRHEGNKS